MGCRHTHQSLGIYSECNPAYNLQQHAIDHQRRGVAWMLAWLTERTTQALASSRAIVRVDTAAYPTGELWGVAVPAGQVA